MTKNILLHINIMLNVKVLDNTTSYTTATARYLFLFFFVCIIPLLLFIILRPVVVGGFIIFNGVGARQRSSPSDMA